MSSTAHQFPPKMKAIVAATTTTTQRWHQASFPRHLCHFSAIDRTPRRHKISLRRHQASFPPANSAEIMQLMRILRHL